MGLLGAMTGAGQGMADFGKMGVANAFETERDNARLEAQERMQDKRDASAEERAKRIEEWKIEAELKKLDDPRYISANERKAKLEADKAASKAEAEESAKLRAKNSPEAIAAEERAHKRKLGEISAEADAKAKAEGKKGGWKPDEADKEVRALVSKGMGIDSANFTNFNAQTEKRFINNVSAASRLMAQDPELTPAAAVEKVLAGDYAGMEAEAKDQEAETAARKQATKEAKGKAGLLSSDESDFGSGGREAWIERRTQELLQKPSAAPQNNGGTMAKPPVDRLKEGVITRFANGQSWTLKGGQPVQVK